MNDQMARIWKVMVVTGTSVYYPSTLLERLRKTTRSLNQDSTLTNSQTGHPSRTSEHCSEVCSFHLTLADQGAKTAVTYNDSKHFIPESKQREHNGKRRESHGTTPNHLGPRKNNSPILYMSMWEITLYKCTSVLFQVYKFQSALLLSKGLFYWFSKIISRKITKAY